jgi:spermidine/putrescine-binding protein
MDHIAKELLASRLTRRRFLQASAVAAGALAAGSSLATRVRAQDAQGGTFNWMTWSDHYYQEQLDEIGATANILPSISALSDNADGFTKLKEVGGQLDLISGDALWVPAYFDAGLIEAWDINELEVAKTLYPLAREFEIWTRPEGYLGYPFGWSPVQIYYDPAHVSPAPDSWEVLLDPKYAGRVILEDQPVEICAYMGKYSGAADPYNMTDEELAVVKDLLTQLKPNILRLAPQNDQTIDALASGEAWLGTGNLGTDERVLEAGGPALAVFTPKEGTIGWMDAEMIVAGGANTGLIRPFLELAETPEHIAENFLRYGRPLFNEGAYQVLVDNGHQERADRFLFNKPETVLTMTLKGPGLSTQGAIDAFNEVFGA